jgi:hypothetical protein
MSNTSINYRTVISTAWAGMLAVLLAMLMIDTLRYAMAGAYQELTAVLAHDPGAMGLQVLVAMLCLNTLVQVLVHIASSKPWRAALFVLTVLYTLFFLAHQIVHLAMGETLGLHTLLDVTHHLLGVLGCWGCWKWWKSAV